LLKDYKIDQYVLIDFNEMPDDITGAFKKLSTTWNFEGDSYEYWWEF